MKHLIFLLFVSFSSFATTCPNLELPASFSLEEKFWSVGSDFTLTHEGKNLGKVVEKVLNIGTTFEFYSGNNELVAKGEKVVFSLGTKMEVFDCQGVLLGSIEEKIFDSWFSFYSNYSIKNSQGQEIAKSKQTKLGQTTFELFMNDSLAAKMHRPWLRLTDNWTVSLNNKTLDPRFVVMIGAFKTASDNKRAASSNNTRSH